MIDIYILYLYHNCFPSPLQLTDIYRNPASQTTLDNLNMDKEKKNTS